MSGYVAKFSAVALGVLLVTLGASMLLRPLAWRDAASRTGFGTPMGETASRWFWRACGGFVLLGGTGIGFLGVLALAAQ
ncbi:MAG: hypothetical protein Q7W30_08795 [Coriobacteriia bacterium]|nr:hypothetical protein [Coriobacteriia bacterium]